jgi:hypothetical protein
MAGPQNAWILRSIICVKLWCQIRFHRGTVALYCSTSIPWGRSVNSACCVSGSLVSTSWGLETGFFTSAILLTQTACNFCTTIEWGIKFEMTFQERAVCMVLYTQTLSTRFKPSSLIFSALNLRLESVASRVPAESTFPHGLSKISQSLAPIPGGVKVQTMARLMNILLSHGLWI